MWALFVGLTFGLLASARSNTPEVKSRSCTHHGVFHVEGRDRYVLTHVDAEALCQDLNTTLATREQVENAYNSNMETCRYGWIANMSIAILRHTAHEKCFLNQTGISIKAANASDLSDAYCYEETDSADLKNCDKAINPSSTNPDSSEDATTEAPVSGELTDGPDSTAEPTLEPGLVPVNPTTDVLVEPRNDTTSEPLDFGEDPTDASDLSTEEGVMGERGFNTTAVGPEEDQRTSPTEKTTVSFRFDETTGSGILPSEIPKPDDEVMEAKPTQANPNSNTVNAPNSRKKVDGLEQPEKQEEKEGNDWLVIIGVLVALAAIVLVCAAVVTRKRWCGKHQTLNISKNGGGGGGEGNGSAAAVVGSRAEEREQEMVTLMNKEKIQENGNAEEFTAINIEGSSEKA
ncbi:CD44 antigen [Sardina pilchardus]|uniref:CD44 antigen n=1 Tax=Sardina pilchardus TaxID=27697 RepID=UPI002E12BD52